MTTIFALYLALAQVSTSIVDTPQTAEKLAAVYFERVLGKDSLTNLVIKCIDDGPTWLIETEADPNLKADDYPALHPFVMRISKSIGAFISIRPIDAKYLRWRDSLRRNRRS